MCNMLVLPRPGYAYTIGFLPLLDYHPLILQIQIPHDTEMKRVGERRDQDVWSRRIYSFRNRLNHDSEVCGAHSMQIFS